MSVSSDAARLIEQDLLLKADVLSHYLSGLDDADPDLAARVLAEIVSRLERALRSEAKSAEAPSRRLSVVPSRDDAEEFILEILSTSPTGLSVQDIVDRFEEASIDIKRPTLVVRLHRMVRAGKLTTRAHGHYILSEAEHARRRSS